MSNDYYNHVSGAPGELNRGASATIRSEFDLVGSGLDKLPSTAQMWSGSENYATAGGSPDAWTVSVAPTYLLSYVDGMQIRVKFAQSNATTTPTLNLNSLGAKTILAKDGSAIAAGNIPTGVGVEFTYDSAAGKFRMEPGIVNLANINIVAADKANIDTVAGAVANVNTVAGISANVTTVAGVSGNVTTVAGISPNVTTVAGVSAAVTTVAGISGNVTTVANNNANVTTVAGISGNVTTVATAAASVTTVAGIAANVTTVAGNNANVTTVAGISANVTTVAGDHTAIAAVAADLGNIDATVTNLSTINQAALAIATAGVYANSAATNVPRGLTQASVGAITGGSGGTTGTFALAWSSGNFAVNPTGTFTVAAGAVTAVTITGPGLYIGSSPTVPTPSFAASSGLTGAAVALTAQFLITSGQGYWVQSTDGLSLQRYKNVSGVATADTTSVHSLPTTDVTDPLHATAVSGVEYAIQDGNDNASEYVEPSTGKRYFLDIDVTNTINGIPRYRLMKATRSSPSFSASIVHHISYGQSVSLGSDSIKTIAAIDSGFFDCLMFNANGVTTAGPRAQEGLGTQAQNHGSLIAFEERPTSGGSPSGNFQTPLGTALRQVKSLLRDEDGIASTDYEYAILGSAPGQSNTAIGGLVKGQTPYTNLIADVTFGLSLSTAAGKSYAVDVVYWCQGERDIELNTSRATYLAALQQLYTDLNTDIKALTGQTNDIKMIAYQCSTFEQFTGGMAGANIALAQLDAAKANANIILATCVYAYEHSSATDVHPDGFGEANFGAMFGLCAKRVIVDGGSWPLMYPQRIVRQGTILDLEWPDSNYPLTIDNALFPTQTNAGLTATLVNGVTDNPITSVTVVGPRRIRVVLTTAAAGRIRYGFASWGGNIRNTRDTSPYMARTANLYQPSLTFDEAFA